ncbi:MAG: ATP-binding protein [Bacteroidota bacterium]
MRREIFVGREKEQEILRKALHSYEAEMVAVIGRRRIGKTYLIKETYKDHISFEITGLQNAPLDEQLDNFIYQMIRAFDIKQFKPKPKSWLKAFMLLIDHLETLDFSTKKVVFLDELSWLATPKSGFLRAFGFFWNSWAVNKNIVVVICGSAASWMIQKVVNHRGGLHNRITKLISLKPFTLGETQQYLEARNIYFSRYQIVQLYMALGGVPHYLKEVEGTKSAIQNIDAICFSETGLLRDEFQRLYTSLFDNAEKHISIIRALAKSRQGLTRGSIIQATKVLENGNLSKVLDELVQSGFIAVNQPFGKKKKGSLYRLTDEYSLFYLQFIENHQQDGANTWHHLSQTQQFKTWSGYAYENICFAHIAEIKSTLGISGIYSVSSSFYKKGTTDQRGTQIDLLIDRNDHSINLIEVKFYNESFALTKNDAEALREKMGIFRQATKTKKHLSWVMITTFGLQHNQHSLGLIQNIITLDDLFST